MGSGLIPPKDCAICPRLLGYRAANRATYPDFFNAPVPAFGDDAPHLLIVGLAPGLKGANRTGRPFTGDYAGDLLYATLAKFGYLHGIYQARADDGIRLEGVRISNAVKCAPPDNKPETDEIKSCQTYLRTELETLGPGLRAILALGLIAHNAVLMAYNLRRAAYPFGHGARHGLPNGVKLYDSYHCSRYNTNTGRLTPAMFEAVFANLADEKS